jgi:hypothetical protein
VQVWDAWLHDVYTPCISVHVAAAQAAAAVLAHALPAAGIATDSMLD